MLLKINGPRQVGFLPVNALIKRQEVTAAIKIMSAAFDFEGRPTPIDGLPG